MAKKVLKIQLYVTFFLFKSFLLSGNCARGGRYLQMSTRSIRITTYNVLSSSLAGADYFTNCKKEFLAADYRLKVLKSKLSKEIDAKSIICLQEVSTFWAGALHVYFASKNYHMITGLYGNKFNGYMGVATAYPADEYELLEADITRVGDTKRLPKKQRPSYIKKLFMDLYSMVYSGLSKLLKWKANPWTLAINRNNQVIAARYYFLKKDIFRIFIFL